jgi:hypothetical protein
MTINELHSILDSIPYGILTHDNSDYEFYDREMSHGIEIRFEYDNFIKCYLIVYTSGYMRDVTIPYWNDYDKCVQAMKNTKTYLEILGFKTI